MTGNYDDIIYMKRPVNMKHPKMSMHDRAAQFAPFAALTGHKEAIEETARTTDSFILIDENEKAELDYILNYLLQLNEEREVSVTYFEEDEFKSGGRYVTSTEIFKKADLEKGWLVFKSGKRISVDYIIELVVN